MRHWIEVAGTRLSCEDEGSGPALVFLHAFPLDARMWEATAAKLKNHYRVLRPSWRGFAAPPRPEVSSSSRDSEEAMQVSVARLADDVAEICQALYVHHCIVVGCSIGGYVMFPLIERYGGLVSAAVFCDTRPQADTADGRRARFETNRELQTAMGTADEANARRAFRDRMLKRLLGKDTLERSPEVVAVVARWISEAPTGAIIALNGAMADRGDSTALLAKIRVPALVINGDQDAVVPANDARAWASELPSARFALIPGAGHLPNVENPEAFERELTAFLAGISRMPAAINARDAFPGDELTSNL